MRLVDAHEWALLKEHAASHLTDPRWQHGAYCVAHTDVRGRIMLPMGPWDAVVLAPALKPHTP